MSILPGSTSLVGQLRLFKDRLLDLSALNPSVLSRREVQARSFDLAKLGPRVIADVGSRLLRGDSGVLLVRESDESPEASHRRRHLQVLRRNVTARAEETGLKEFYLGLCWLSGHLDQHVFVRAPLLLVPAALEVKRSGRDTGWHVQFDFDGLVGNSAIAAAIRKCRGTTIEGLTEQLPELLEVAKTTEHTDVLHLLFKKIAHHLASAGVQVATQENLSPWPLREVKRDETTGPQVPLMLTRELVLGLFPQSNTALYADLESLEEKAMSGEADLGIVHELLETLTAAPPEVGHERGGEEDIAEASVHPVVPIDPSQLRVLRLAQIEECVVVRGPPGTGKSQLIVNLISDAMARGQRVLVACQKRAALDVVYRRLEERGLTDAVALVHDATNDRPELYRKLARTLRPQERTANLPLEDAGDLGESVDTKLHSLRDLVAPLGAPWHGLPLHNIYALAGPLIAPVLEIKTELLSTSSQELARLSATVEQAKPGTLRFADAAHPLVRRRNWATLGRVEASRLRQALSELESRLRSNPSWAAIPGAPAARVLRDNLDIFMSLRERWYRAFLPRWWQARAQVLRAAGWFSNAPVNDWRHGADQYLEAATLIEQVSQHMAEPWLGESLALLKEPRVFADELRRARDSLETEFVDIRAYDEIVQTLDEAELQVLHQCATRLDPTDDWGAQLQREVFLRWIDEAEATYPQLRGKVGPSYESLRARVLTTSKKKLDATARALAARLRSAACTPTLDPREQAHPNRRPSTDWNKLVDECEKKRRVKPIRALLQDYSWPMQQATRCWLASPEVVAEVFPLERGIFDVVIFDEASQLTIERAVPVLYRGKRIVIAGDEQQMPPSHFFRSSLEEDDEEGFDTTQALGEARFSDSLLVQAKRVFGAHYLAWHYRSQYQELIEFSNHAFYEGMLEVAANTANAGCYSAERAIRWIGVNGMWANNTNSVEAVRAVDELAQILRDRPSESVGIITFNQKQQSAIEDAIEQRRNDDSEFDELYASASSPNSSSQDDRPFVKNIENVQGDERDHIIFSIGYGPGPDGVFRRNFGPLSNDGGENRLNVAITRARRGARVICSFDPGTLGVETAKNRGPVLLKKYLEYAKAVDAADATKVREVLASINPQHQAQGHAARDPSFDSPFETQVYEALQRHGLTLKTQWGAGGYHIDLVVVDPKDPSRFCLGIECDGAKYHSGKNVRERDIARQAFLENRGWRIHRIWSRDWWQDPRGEVQGVLALVNASS